MRAGRADTTFKGNKIEINAIIIERGDNVSLQELLDFARNSGYIYVASERQRISVYFEASGRLFEDFPVDELEGRFKDGEIMIKGARISIEVTREKTMGVGILEFIEQCRKGGLIYRKRGTERVSLYFEETGNSRIDFPVGALSVYFLVELGKKNSYTHK